MKHIPHCWEAPVVGAVCRAVAMSFCKWCRFLQLVGICPMPLPFSGWARSLGSSWGWCRAIDATDVLFPWVGWPIEGSLHDLHVTTKRDRFYRWSMIVNDSMIVHYFNYFPKRRLLFVAILDINSCNTTSIQKWSFYLHSLAPSWPLAPSVVNLW